LISETLTSGLVHRLPFLVEPPRSKGHRDMPKQAKRVIFGEDFTNPLGLSKIDRKCYFGAVFGCWAGLISNT